MSMRPRGAATGGRRSRQSAAPVYEDFKPTFEWKHEDGASILLYHLPGFSKEQIRIVAESKGILRVRGERLVTSNRWSRFHEEVMVPQDCNLSEVRAKFEGGILQITMPKKTPTIHKETLVEKPPPNNNNDPTTFQQPQPQPQSRPQPQSQPRPRPRPRPQPQSQPPPRPQPQPRLQDPFTLPSTPPSPIPRNEQSTKPPFDEWQSKNNQDDDASKVTKDEKEKEKEMMKEKHKEDHYYSQVQEKHDKYVDALGDQEDKVNFHKLDKNQRYDDTKSSESKSQLLINMGVVILVIVALGSQIYYSYDSNA